MLRLNGPIGWALAVLMQGALLPAVILAQTENPNVSCDNEYAYYPDPNDCSSFFQCINGTKQHMECVSPLLWDNHIQGCEEESDCSQVISTTSGNSESTSTQVISTTFGTSEPTSTKLISTTPGETTSTSTCNDNDLKPDPKNCKSFYFCENNQWYGPQDCPSDLFWSDTKKGCVNYTESDCGQTTPENIIYY
ncbi:uncharacterized protein LOC126883524 isoform X1 [Diabrotica virgifera virgifera]|uniref:Chitin-binding type-2 domain-containing protein n=1 Tax=Diabrotica virgifera virgifera TaxID=50390 RepID=A0ABM5K4J4_DIAVI|nr:uncharacterized protein LOC126883524 isoform X1 [Diabrotica virgifera virgifera]